MIEFTQLTSAEIPEVEKPWYKIRSRYALNPESGGINGTPSAAVPSAGEQARDEIVRILSDKVQAIIEAEQNESQ